MPGSSPRARRCSLAVLTVATLVMSGWTVTVRLNVSAAVLDAASSTDRPSSTASGNSYAPAFSADGRHVVFVSQAHNLVTNDAPGPYLNVFLRDLAGSNTVLVSVNTNGCAGGNENANFPSFSSNGQWIAFESAASNLVPGDTNGFTDIFVHDLAKRRTHLMSRATNDLGGDGPSTSPLLTADGLRLWEESTRSNRLIFPAASPVRCLSPAITPNGRRIAFLVASNATAWLYVQDVATGSNRVAGLTTNGQPATVNEVTQPAIPPDGRQVAFETLDSRLVEDDFNQAADIFTFDLDASATQLVSPRHAGRPGLTQTPMSTAAPRSLSANGRSAAFVSYDTQRDDDTNDLPNVIVRDLVIGVSHFVSSGGNASSEPALSADGRYVAFSSEA